MPAEGEPVFLELRGLLRRDDFELLRVHELSGARARRLRLQRREGLSARLSDQDGTMISEGTVGVLGVTYADDSESALPIVSSELIRILLPLTEVHERPRDLVAELLDRGHTIWRDVVLGEPPRIDAAAEVGREMLRLRWSSDVDAAVDVHLRRNDGRRVRIASGLRGGSAELPVNELPGGMAVVEVSVVAGLREAVAITAPVELPARPASLTVYLERDEVPPGQPVTATLSIQDSWGQPTDEDHARWLVDGEQFGSGQSVVMLLDPGSHVIEVELEGAAGGSAKLLVHQTDRSPAADAAKSSMAHE